MSAESARTTNVIERLHEEFKRRIKTQTVLPSADTAAMLFWALLASGQIITKVDAGRRLPKAVLGRIEKRQLVLGTPRGGRCEAFALTIC